MPDEPRPDSLHETVDLSSLVLDGSPRLHGEDETHTMMLADVSTPLPPILVHRGSMRVLDGIHRVRAAILRGDKTINAMFFDGDANAAFVEAVRANIAHGLPLTLADRRAAAERILELYPGWSDRAIATVTGLSPTTVRVVRERATDQSVQMNTRVGQDGRARPLDAAQGRHRAAEVLADHPDASLREVARRAGVSVATARDVRQRIRAGRDPAAPALRSAGVTRVASQQPVTAPVTGNGSGRARVAEQARPPASILADLARDPSLRFSESGRELVRWLYQHVISVDEWGRVAGGMPPHCGHAVAEVAVACADAWARVAEQVSDLERAETGGAR
jgi:ParB-like chromosome segregation protein Spo0J